MATAFNSGPLAPERNPPIEPQYFQPSRFVISDITLGTTTTITTSVDNNYVVGQLIRLVIPSQYGTRKLNEQQAYVIDVPASDEVTLNIDTSIGYDAFISSPVGATNDPQIMSIGDVNSGQINASGPRTTTTYIPGSFINISPA